MWQIRIFTLIQILDVPLNDGESKILHMFRDALPPGRRTERAEGQDRAILEYRHLLLQGLERHEADLGRYREEECAAFTEVGLDPHSALHEVHQAFRDG